eukprot:2378340-Amphidinium_carterae.1
MPTDEDVRETVARLIDPRKLSIPMSPGDARLSFRILKETDAATLSLMPPHYLVHLMRTAANEGTQVVSPRQVPLTWAARR